MSVQELVYPYEIKDIEAHEKEQVAKLYIDGNDLLEYIRVGPKGYFFHKNFEKMAADIYNMELRPTDMFVATCPRAGTTWTQELVWLIANDMDFETAKSTPLTARYVFIEFSSIYNVRCREIVMKMADNKGAARKFLSQIAIPIKETLQSMPDPRFIKTHLPMSLLPPNLLDKSKIVYVARDPRDVVVSSYHHTVLLRKMFGFNSDFKQFWDTYRHDLFVITPFFENVKEAWALRHHPNMLFLFYEELAKDMPLTDDNIRTLCDHLSFENFKNNNSVNLKDMRDIGMLADGETFIRKGKVSSWRGYFEGEMIQELQSWIDENLQNTDLIFPTINYI
ncbi:hypothetical protein K1T71_004102 [Dendrolimus kikuchii]|uniref:Uncharacterized protein n=1 Tax=Dendrolimus kikuchii TaxID=765133 RepID=A0ACC1D9Q9_9NEOP|nr:hypothetical protein K1T71_004102 [Dendrolimus kikuchii]